MSHIFSVLFETTWQLKYKKIVHTKIHSVYDFR